MNELETMVDNISKSVPILECDLYKNTGMDGLYVDGNILIEKKLYVKDKKVVLMEEYHHATYTQGNVLDEKSIDNKKQENFVRRKNFEMLFTSSMIIEGYKMGFNTFHEVADYYELPESFIREAIEHYQNKHGLMWNCDQYVIYLGNGIEIFKNDTSKNIYDI
ncbi:toxin [Listeria fleischmannii]|uniref:toxin n=1 Tax=Listeria fleischmannii TaxID=1069827 RepID=UPI000E04D3C7|nr:toxin [Listeria fleischmannii]MBC1419407.1 toxin [Listeria fleischmannii]STY35298.1 Uncharacterised protein [Listeria fleischmannii subsp. coloradonensis]